MKRLLLLIIGIFLTHQTFAGIDYSRYDDAPILFFGWETSILFGIAAIVLFAISYAITESKKNTTGEVEVSWLLIIINLAMIICAICSFYFLIILGTLYIIYKSYNEKR